MEKNNSNQMEIRRFMANELNPHKTIGIKLLLIFMTLSISVCPYTNGQDRKELNDKPNILWITCEDISPYLGSYGHKDALTPNLDKLAEKGIRFTRAYANAPVCAVARSTILSGMYASTLGTHHMRTHTKLPESIPAYPKILREAGYYCTNNNKRDYNSSFMQDTTLWDESNKTAHWRNAPKGKPFFSVFNIGVTHESQIDQKNIARYVANGEIPEKPRVHPDSIVLPPYHPDLPEIRQDWARLHDLITRMDEIVGDLLGELEEEGVAENTIVFFYSDHGGQLARSKRYIYNVGTQVPFIVYLPDRWKHLSQQKPGDTNKNLVSFVDFPKTVLAMANCPLPDKMQGRAFLGNRREPAQDYVHFFRDRMGSRYDFSRAVTDGKHYFIRNFMPHRPRGRDSRYGYWVQANWRAWEQHCETGKCDTVQSQFYRPKPVIQLFDTEADPWHVSDLTKAKIHHKKLQKLSAEMDRWMVRTRDIGLIPEPMIMELVGTGKKHKTIYEYAQSKDYPIADILQVAKNCSLGNPDLVSDYLLYLNNENPIIRFWGSYAFFLLRQDGDRIQSKLLDIVQQDAYATNRIMAAQALGLCGDPDKAYEIITKELDRTPNGYTFLQALNALQYTHTDNRLGKEDWIRLKSRTFPDKQETNKYGKEYSQRIIDDALALWPKTRKVE